MKHVQRVIAAVASEFGISSEDLLGGRRYKRLVRARDMAALVLRDYLLLSFKEIGNELGGKDHATMISSVRRAKKRIEMDVAFKTLHGNVTKRIKPTLKASGVNGKADVEALRRVMQELEQGKYPAVKNVLLLIDAVARGDDAAIGRGLKEMVLGAMEEPEVK